MMRAPLLITLSATLSIAGCGLATDPLGGQDDDGDRGAGAAGAAPSSRAFVLAHGFGGDRQNGFGDVVAEAIAAAGFEVFKAEVPAVESIAVRGAALATEIDGFLAASSAQSVHIIAHSMGGLDSRYLISTLGYADRVRSLATVSTPHDGTPLADTALGLLGSGADQQAAGDALADLLAGTPLDPAAFERGVIDLTEAAAPAFNAANLDVAGVTYLSFAGLSTPGGLANPNADTFCQSSGAAVPSPDRLRPLLFLAAPIVTGTDLRPNDGVVPIDSAIWGEFRGCIAADHIDENGAFDTGNSGIDAPAFYAALATELAALP